MATLSITKTYEDGTSLFESDLNSIVNAIIRTINVDKLNASNINSSSITAAKLDSSIVDDLTVENSGSELRIKDNGIGLEKMTLQSKQAPVGTITMFHTYNGTLSIPRGWLPCNDQLINETNYNSVHGAGAYTTDGISSSALLSKYLPGLNSTAYPIGTASTTETGAGSMSTVGSNTVDLEHNHIWYNYINTSSSAQIYRTGVAASMTSGNFNLGSGLLRGIIHALYSAHSLVVAEDLYTDNKLSASTSIVPLSIKVIYIMKVI